VVLEEMVALQEMVVLPVLEVQVEMVVAVAVRAPPL
jgi:hypothetical protein